MPNAAQDDEGLNFASWPTSCVDNDDGGVAAARQDLSTTDDWPIPWLGMSRPSSSWFPLLIALGMEEGNFMALGWPSATMVSSAARPTATSYVDTDNNFLRPPTNRLIQLHHILPATCSRLRCKTHD